MFALGSLGEKPRLPIEVNDPKYIDEQFISGERAFNDAVIRMACPALSGMIDLDKARVDNLISLNMGGAEYK